MLIQVVRGVGMGIGVVAVAVAVRAVRQSRIVEDGVRAIACGVQNAKISFNQSREIRRLAEGNAIAEAMADSLVGGTYPELSRV